MLLFSLVWAASHAEYFFSSGHAFFQTPERFFNVLPTKVLSIAYRSASRSEAGSPLQLKSAFHSTYSSPPALLARLSAISGDRAVATAKPANWLGAIEQATAQITEAPSSQSLAQTPQEWASSPVAAAPPPSTPLTNSLDNPVLRTIQGLFNWSAQHEANLSTAHLVVVRRASYTVPSQEDTATPEQRGILRYSLANSLSAPTTQRPVFQVWLRNYLVAELPDRSQADWMAQQLKNLLQTPGWDAAQLQPSVVGGHPAGKLGDRVLFVVKPAIATYLNRTNDLLAIEWVNNLRIALATPPLTLAEAQTQLYGLAESSQKIEGLASWYGPYFHGRITATGETFNQHELTAAHPSLPFDTYLKVTNLKSGKAVIVRINDRGPYFENRSLDLSWEAARQIGSDEVGVVPYEAVIMKPTAQSIALNPALQRSSAF
jgi:rare lipoprotein A